MSVSRQREAYLFQEVRKWKPVVSGKGPDLAGCRGDFANDRGDDVDDDNGRHDMRGGVAVRNIEEELDEWKAGLAVEEGLGIGNSKAKGDNDNISQHRIEANSPQHCSWKGIGSVFDLFGYQ